ncbi:MAG: TonB-dependent receptor [Acidobacteria bacterium]|nr:TonB-dependent receptor [Acidobacteriota bacterium]
MITGRGTLRFGARASGAAFTAWVAAIGRVMPGMAVMVIMAVMAPLAHGQSPGSVRGTVVDDLGGAPLVAAVVTLEPTGRSVTTGPDGVFVIDDVPAGAYSVRVVREGFAGVTSRIDVVADSAVRMEIRLPLAEFEERVTVSGIRSELSLTGETSTGTRLGLRAIDVPASIDVIDSTVMDTRGYQTLGDAVETLPGILVGENPAAPASFSVRGFTRSEVTVVRDGIWLGPANMVMRPQNTFNLDRIELLRGPSSVLNGQGAVAGTVNAITKQATPTATTQWNGLISYGRFNSYQTAVGVNGPINDTLWYRLDVSQYGSDGFVDRASSGSSNVTGSLLWRPSARADLKFSVDYLDDDVGSYFGTPLLPTSAIVDPLDVITTSTGEGIDARTRFVNYNVSDPVNDSRQVLIRSDSKIRLSDQVTLNNTLYGFDATRNWQNAEGYVYCTSVVDVCTQVDVIQRYYGYFFVDHDQRLFGDRLHLDVRTPILGRDNRATIGFERSTLDFNRGRGFRRNEPQVPGDAVDLLNPVPGLYGPRELRGTSPTGINAWSFFGEDSLPVTDRIRVTGALRYDGMNLDRANFNAAGIEEPSGFTRDFRWWSWRAGGVVTLRQNLVAYGQFSDAKDPVNGDLFLVNASEDFDLTDARQWEVGMKADLAAGRTQVTAAWFDIERDDILQRFALDSATTIGGITSRGLELSAAARPTDDARLGGSVAWTDAQFLPSPNFVRFAGNTPPNVPSVVTTLWGSYGNLGGLPMEVGGDVRFVGDRQANNANTITLNGYGRANAYVAWTRDRVRVSFNIDNLTDEAYASWSDIFYLGETNPSFIYSNTLMLGAPRTYSLMLQLGL